MSYEEEFDKIVRQKAAQAEYPFSDADWQKASAMLDARNAVQKTGMAKWILPALITVTAGVGTMLYFGYEDKTISHQQIAEVRESKNVSATAVEESTPAFNKVPVTTETENVKPESESTISPQKTELNTMTASQPAAASAHKTNTSLEKIPVSENKNAGADIEAKDIKADIAKNEDIDNKDAGGEKNNLNLLPVAPVVPVVAAGADLADQSDIQEENNVSANDNANAGEVTEAQANEELKPAFMLAKSTLLVGGLQPVDLLNLPFTALKRYDDDYYHKTRHRQYLTLEGGGTYFFGWDTKNGKDGKGTDYYMGAHYGYYFARNWSASLGLQMYSISNITQPFYETQQKSYGFGYTSSYASITTDHLVYGAVPLRLNYHFTKFSLVGAGFSAGYLLQNHNRIDAYQISDGAKGPVNSSFNYNVYESTSNINMMASVLFATRVHKRVGLNAEFVYGLSDLFKNNSAVSNNEKAMGLRLGVTYYIFEK